MLFSIYRSVTLLLLSSLAFVSGGCMQGPSYAWCFCNATGTELKELSLNSVSAPQRTWSYVGDFGHTKVQTDTSGYYPMPEKGILRWKGPDHRWQEQVITIAPDVPHSDHFDGGDLWFKYTAKGWVLIPMTADEILRRAIDSQKGNLPTGVDPAAPFTQEELQSFRE